MIKLRSYLAAASSPSLFVLGVDAVPSVTKGNWMRGADGYASAMDMATARAQICVIEIRPRREVSRQMTDDLPRTLIEDLLVAGLRDWIDPSWIYSVVMEETDLEKPEHIRSLSLGLTAELIANGFVVAGETRPDFAQWKCSSAESIERITREWSQRENPIVMPSEICYMAITPLGEGLARNVLRRESGATSAD